MNKNLGFQDAMKAYANGETIIGSTGVEYWINESGKPKSSRVDYDEDKAGTPNERGVPYRVKGKSVPNKSEVVRILYTYRQKIAESFNEMIDEIENMDW